MVVCYSNHSLCFPEVYMLAFSILADFHLKNLNSSQKVLVAFVMFKRLATLETIRVNP